MFTYYRFTYSRTHIVIASVAFAVFAIGIGGANASETAIANSKLLGSLLTAQITMPDLRPGPSSPSFIPNLGDDMISDTCSDRSKCGPMLGLANSRCSDGSLNGPTGRCLKRKDGSCGWEVRSCTNNTKPGDACTKSECGPQPLGANYICTDGSKGGPTGKCLRNAKNKCSWEVRSCRRKGDSGSAKCGDGICQNTATYRESPRQWICEFGYSPCPVSCPQDCH